MAQQRTLAAFPKTLISFPVPLLRDSQLFITSTSGDLALSSGLHRYIQVPVASTYRHTDTQTYTTPYTQQ